MFGREISKFKYCASSIDLQRAQSTYYISLNLIVMVLCFLSLCLSFSGNNQLL